MVANISQLIKTFCFLVSKVKPVSDNVCYNDSVRDAVNNYNFESCDMSLDDGNGLNVSLQMSNNPDVFYSSFTSLIFSNANFFFTTVDHFIVTLMAMNLVRQMY